MTTLQFTAVQEFFQKRGGNQARHHCHQPSLRERSVAGRKVRTVWLNKSLRLRKYENTSMSAIIARGGLKDLHRSGLFLPARGFGTRVHDFHIYSSSRLAVKAAEGVVACCIFSTSRCGEKGKGSTQGHTCVYGLSQRLPPFNLSEIPSSGPVCACCKYLFSKTCC